MSPIFPQGAPTPRQRQILEAAEAVFARRGYRGTTMGDIAGAVGFTQPALYRYFASKEELFMGALALRQQEIADRYRDSLAGPGRAIDKIRALVETTLELALEHPEMARLRLQAIALADEPAVRSAVAGTITDLLAAHTALFEKAREEGDLEGGLHASTAASVLAGMALLLYVNLALDLPDAAPERALAAARNFLDSMAGS
jgi:AcrR family transcriptional regulator